MNEKKKGLFARLREGLSKTRGNMTDRMDDLVRETRKIDDGFYDELEELLVLSDAGVPLAEKVVKGMRKLTWERRFRKGHEARQLRSDGAHPMVADGEFVRTILESL